MNNKFIGKAKRIISGFVAAAMAVTILPQIPAFAETGSTTYSYDGYDVEYSVLNEWDNGQSVEVKVTNTGNESILNWALKCDVEGEISNLWSASVYANQDKEYIIKNDGWNYEIAPGQTINFGYTLTDDEFEAPDNFELCSKCVEMTDGYETALNIIEQWDTGFNAELVITNISDEPIEAWTYSFDSNFIIENLWDARILECADNHYTIASEMWTNPIAVGDSKAIGFTATLNSDIIPEITNENLTHIVIDENLDTPVKPDEPKEHIIICFGEYIKDENAINVFWYSTDDSSVSLYESSNDGEWTKFAEVSDDDSYKYVITDDFQAKQIKAVQETKKDGTIESEPFSIKFSGGKYTCTLPDDDNDGLPNIIEKIYGTDPENPDTDDDGLTDYEEVYITGTEPLKYDTNDNGINDADDDSDGDGLSNKEEIELGTDPQNIDTDGDGLSDYDELNKYNTDPLKEDSDGDTLKDGDEIEIGLDPNDPETFGVPDAEYKIKQTVSADSKALKRVNTEESPYKLSLEVNASGNVNCSLNADRSSYSTVVNSDIQLGETIDLKYIGGDVDEVKLNFTIGDAYLDNELNLFPDEEAIQGIKRLNIFKYFEDINMLLPIETVIDEENNTISATVDELGTYCVVDMEKWLNNLIGTDMPQAVSLLSDDDDEFYIEVEETPDFSEEETRISMSSDAMETDETNDEESVEATASVFRAAAAPYAPPYAEGFTPVSVGTPVDVVFLLQTAGNVDYYFWDQIEMIRDVMDELQKSHGKDNVRVCVITYELSKATILSPSTWFTNSEDLQNALYGITYEYTNSYVNRGSAFNELINNVAFKKSASKFVFQVMNGNTTVGSGYFSQLDACSKLSINYSEIMPESWYYENLAYGQKVEDAISKTGGVSLIYDFGPTTRDVYEHICKCTAPPQIKFNALVPTGWKTITLNAVLDEENGIDTDEDELTDWDEVDTDRLSWDVDGSVVLPTIERCISFAEKPYAEDGLSRFKAAHWVSGMPSTAFEQCIAYVVSSTYVLPIFSDPTKKDSDGDEIDDKYDPHALNMIDSESVCIYSENKELLTDDKYHLLKRVTEVNGASKYVCINCGYTRPVYSAEYEKYLIYYNSEQYDLPYFSFRDYNHLIEINNIRIREFTQSLNLSLKLAEECSFGYTHNNIMFASLDSKLFSEYDLYSTYGLNFINGTDSDSYYKYYFYYVPKSVIQSIIDNEQKTLEDGEKYRQDIITFLDYLTSCGGELNPFVSFFGNLIVMEQDDILEFFRNLDRMPVQDKIELLKSLVSLEGDSVPICLKIEKYKYLNPIGTGISDYELFSLENRLTGFHRDTIYPSYSFFYSYRPIYVIM